jgi:hypothetical protein
MEASPSLLGQLEVGTVQAVSVCIPPLTLWISSSLNERAPLRASTLFWSFMLFSFLYFWSVTLAQLNKKPCQIVKSGH